MNSTRPPWANRGEGRFFTRIEVTTMLNGAMLALPLHVVTGTRDGPTLGVITNVHGDEFLPTTVIRQLIGELDPARMRGRLAVVSVANPLATANFGRQTPEQHGRTAGGRGGRLQARVDYNSKAPAPVKRKSLEFSRAFGAPFVHENDLTGTASHYLNGKGIATANPEVGGAYLGPDDTAHYFRQCLTGLRNLMAALGMLPGYRIVRPKKQLLFNQKGRRELRPAHSGYLVSHYQRPQDLGKLIRKGTRLGETVDIYSYRVLEEIRAPFDGYLFFSRYSGVVGAGTQAFALAEAATSEWLR
ncbi:MAG: succinylglutamate desuccinylase/aspartoacylase family protein [Betaproteobacteria bacterium]|nr:succinylglutamate desuccinylase/aspartoacylase family protein [Betaproteobacteria bacterium]